jgi:hypothetical protein
LKSKERKKERIEKGRIKEKKEATTHTINGTQNDRKKKHDIQTKEIIEFYSSILVAEDLAADLPLAKNLENLLTERNLLAQTGGRQIQQALQLWIDLEDHQAE